MSEVGFIMMLIPNWRSATPATQRPAALRPLTRELDDARSPVRLFLQERYAQGLRDVQRQYRAAAPPLQVPSVSRADADPGTVGTAADWLLRFLLHPQPDIHLAVAGAVASTKAGIMVLPALAGMAGSLNVPMPARPPDSVQVFTGPSRGNHADPALLARSCWALRPPYGGVPGRACRGGSGTPGAVPRQPGRLSGRIAGACTAGRARSAVRVPARVRDRASAPAHPQDRQVGGRADIRRLGPNQG